MVNPSLYRRHCNSGVGSRAPQSASAFRCDKHGGVKRLSGNLELSVPIWVGNIVRLDFQNFLIFDRARNSLKKEKPLRCPAAVTERRVEGTRRKCWEHTASLHSRKPTSEVLGHRPEAGRVQLPTVGGFLVLIALGGYNFLW